MDEPTPARGRTRHPRALALDHLGQGDLTRRGRSSLAAILVAAAVIALPGCNQRAVESWLAPGEGEAERPPLYADEPFTAALAELKKQVPGPIHALSLLVYPDHLVLQAQDPTSPETALQYVYRDGTVSNAVPVKLLGTGMLSDNVFPLDEVKIDAIPRLAREAKTRANIPEGTVARILLRRNLPESVDIQFRIFVSSQRRDATFEADRTGKLLEGKRE